MKTYITFTTWKARVFDIHKTLDSILLLTVLPDKIFLTLSLDEFKSEASLPVFLYFEKYKDILLIIWLKENIKTFKKIIPVLDKIEDDDLLIYIDDDMILPSDFIESRIKDFNDNGSKNPISGINGKNYNVVFSGHGSLIQKKMLNGWNKFFNNDILNTYEDDLFYSYMIILNGYRFIVPSKNVDTELQFYNQESSMLKIGLYNSDKTKEVLNNRLKEITSKDIDISYFIELNKKFNFETNQIEDIEPKIDCIVIIPVYKEKLSKKEIVSFSRCCKILGSKYTICTFTYKELNLSRYKRIAKKYGVQLSTVFLNKRFFTSGETYNYILTWDIFWKTFMSYKYVLLYQLDCYIFRDELKYWIDKDKDQCEILFDNHHYNGQGLRKVEAFYWFLKNNQDKVKEFLYLHWYGRGYGEDDFFTRNISNYKLDYELNKFGYSCHFRKLYELYGLPMMIHYFGGGIWNQQDDVDWQKEIIGDWETDTESCINKEF